MRPAPMWCSRRLDKHLGATQRDSRAYRDDSADGREPDGGWSGDGAACRDRMFARAGAPDYELDA